MRNRPRRLLRIVLAAVSLSAAGVLSIPNARAQSVTPPPPIWNHALFMGESTDTQSALAAFEDNAVLETLLDKNLPLSDKAALQALGRDDIRAQMWADLGVIMMKDPTARSASDSLVYAWFSKYVQQTLSAGADAAVQEYLNWSGLSLDTYADTANNVPQPRTPSGTGYCNYHPPGPYDTDSEYNGRASTICLESGFSLGDLFIYSPPRPTVDQFVKYGQYDELKAIQSNTTVSYSPITDNDFAAHSGQVAAILGEGSALAVWGSSVPMARALSEPLKADNLLVAKLFPYANRVDSVTLDMRLGKFDDALKATYDDYKAALAADNLAEARLAAGDFTQLQADRLAAPAAAEAEAAFTAGEEVAGAVASVAGAVVDVVVTTTLGAIQINSDLEAPVQLSTLKQGAHNNPPDLRAVLTSEQGYPGVFSTFLNLTFPEAEPNCVGFVQIGNVLRECANAPSDASLGGVPTWDTTEPQFLNGFESSPGSSVVTSWGQVPTIWLDLPDSPGNPPQSNGTLFVRPHGNGWFILQQFLSDGRLTREWMSTSFPFKDWNGDTWLAERVSDATGKYFFNIAPIGATANSLACYPGGGGTPPPGMAWTSCVTDTISYVAAGGRRANVLEMVHGYIPDPNAPPPPPVPPVVTLNGPQTVTQGQPITYTASATDASGTALTYDWLYSCNAQGQPESFCTVSNHGPYLTVSFASTTGGHVGVNVTDGLGVSSSLTDNVIVSAAANTITFAQPVAMAYTRSLVYGRPYPTQVLTFSASSSLPVTVAVDPASAGVCSVSDTVVTAVYVGACTLIASQAGDSVFPAAAPVIRTFSVTPGDYVVNVGDGPLTYAEPAGALATSVLTLYAVDGITGSLGGCQRMGGLSNGAGNVVADVGSYPLAGCVGLSSTKYNVLINGATTVGPKSATLFNTTQQANTIGVAAMTATIVQANDGFPGDITKARVDFLLFRSTNATATPDFAVRAAPANVLGQVAATLSGLPADTYRLILRTSAGDFTAPDNSGPLVVTAPVAPTITQGPQSVTVNAGQTATFTAAATGNPTPSVQWAIVTSGPTVTDIPGATSPTLTLSNVTSAQNGSQYVVRFFNSAGSTNSGIVTLTVVTPTCHYVSLNVNPTTVKAGGKVTATAGVQSCATSSQAISERFTLTGPFGRSCANTNQVVFTTPTFTLKPGTSKSVTFPLIVPTSACRGTYTTTATTLIGGKVIDSTAASLTVQ